jgi:DNA invertase Pin-like site-specific DNA recombinase
MANVYSYVRFSSKKQEQGDSVRRQIKAGDAWLSQNPQHTLETSLSLHDLGVSAFRGANLDEKGALGAFISLAKKSDSPIPKGSILLIERLDRFSRQQTRKAYRSFVDLVEAGITVQTLDPLQTINEDNIDDLHVVLPLILQMTMAHEQSKEKSRRVGSVWESKRQDARDGRPMFKKCPAWLEWSERLNTFQPKPQAVEAVQYIFQRTINGCGQRQLVNELHARFTPIGRSGKWNASYVQKVLADRAVLGELQPFKFDSKGQRVRAGEPIAEYYPRVIENDVFLAASVEKTARRKAKGPNGSFVNLFVGLLQGEDGHALHIQTTRVYGKKRKYVQRRLFSYGHLRGIENACSYSVNYFAVEAIVLRLLYEFDEMALGSEPQMDIAVPAAEARVAAIRRRMDDLRAALVDTSVGAASPFELTEALANLGEQLQEAEKVLKDAVQNRGVATSTELAKARDLVVALRSTAEADQRAVRLRLRSAIARLVEVIEVRVEKRKRRVVPFVTVVMRSGDRRILADGASSAADLGHEGNRTYVVVSLNEDQTSKIEIAVSSQSRAVSISKVEPVESASLEALSRVNGETEVLAVVRSASKRVERRVRRRSSF